MRHNTLYIFAFAAIICIVCGIFVSYSAVALKERQVVNEELDKKKNILQAAGLIEPGEAIDAERVAQLFENIEAVAVDLKTGTEDPTVDAAAYDFDNDRQVGLSDFFLFADHFGRSTDGTNWDPKFDTNSDGQVNFDDFFAFADRFGRKF